MAISPNGGHLAVGHRDLRVYELGDTEGPKEDRRFDRRVAGLAYSPCGRWMALLEAKNVVNLWDLRSGYDARRALEGNSAPILQLIFSPNGRQLFAVVLREPSRLWDTESASLMEVPEISGSAASFSPCGRMLAIGDGDRVHLWNLQDKNDVTILAELEDDAACIVWSPCGVWIAAGFLDGGVRLWKMSNLESVLKGSEVMFIRDIPEPVSCLTWSPIAPLTFATASMTGYVCVWRIAEANGLFRLQMVWGSFPSRLTAFGTQIGQVTGLTEKQKKLLIQRGAIEGSSVPAMEYICSLGFTGKFIRFTE